MQDLDNTYPLTKSAHIDSFIEFLEQESKESTTSINQSPAVSKASFSTLYKAKEKILKLRAELSQAQITIDSLKEAIQDKEMSFNQKLSSIITNHDKSMEANIQYILYRFIEKLLKEKEAYINKIHKLKENDKKLKHSHKEEIEKLLAKHNHYIKMLKQSIKTEEDMRRQTWILQKSQDIKNRTAKALEPEITRLITEHQQALKQKDQDQELNLLNLRQELESYYKDQLRDYELSVNRHYQSLILSRSQSVIPLAELPTDSLEEDQNPLDILNPEDED